MEYLCCADRKPASRTELPLCSSSGRFATLCRPSRCIGLTRISHTLAGAGSVLAAPRAFRALPIQPVSAAALKTLGTTMPFAIIPQWYEKCGLVGQARQSPLEGAQPRSWAGLKVVRQSEAAIAGAHGLNRRNRPKAVI